MSENSKQRVLDAIKKLECRVTAADVSAKTGINLAQTNMLLNQVASETGSILEVSKEGTIVYRFAPNFESIYALQGIRLVLHRAWSVIFAVGFFLFQISFGVMLIVSMVIIVIAILVAIIAFLTGDKDGDSDGPSFNFFGGSGPNSGYNSSGDSAFIFWHTTPVVDSWTDPPKRRQGNFLTDCYSFLFGDGNPNVQLEERKMQYIAKLIQENNGVVAAEQLAPFLGTCNDEAIFSVLVRFEGSPEVSECGNIIYSFAELMKTTQQDQEIDGTERTMSVLVEKRVSTKTVRAVGHCPNYLNEFIIPFSGAPSKAIWFVISCAAFNLLGSIWLLSTAHKLACFAPFAGIAPIMFVYGVLFVSVPLIRVFVNGVKNGGIEKRNKIRQQFAAQLKRPSNKLSIKLLEAKAFAIARETVGETDVVYTSGRDSLEQEFDNQESEESREEQKSDGDCETSEGRTLWLEGESRILNIETPEKVRQGRYSQG